MPLCWAPLPSGCPLLILCAYTRAVVFGVENDCRGSTADEEPEDLSPGPGFVLTHLLKANVLHPLHWLVGKEHTLGSFTVKS